MNDEMCNDQVLFTAKTQGLFQSSLVTIVAILKVKNNPRIFAAHTI